MEKLGTNYGGWIIPTNAKLNEHSIVYSGGVGEDISFDLALNTKYGCHMYLIDPTQKSVAHFNEVKEFYSNKKQFTGGIQSDYISCINKLKPNFAKFTYLNIGINDKPDVLKFYKQSNPNYVSQSIIPGMFTDKYDIVNVDSIKNIMKSQNHTHIDLLKLDIEGAEVAALNQMLDDNIYPDILCVEFDLKLKKKDTSNSTDRLLERLKQFYTIFG